MHQGTVVGGGGGTRVMGYGQVGRLVLPPRGTGPGCLVTTVFPGLPCFLGNIDNFMIFRVFWEISIIS